MMKDHAQNPAKHSAHKRDLFAEISVGFDALERARAGEVALRTHVVEAPDGVPQIPGKPKAKQ